MTLFLLANEPFLSNPLLSLFNQHRCLAVQCNLVDAEYPCEDRSQGPEAILDNDLYGVRSRRTGKHLELTLVQPRSGLPHPGFDPRPIQWFDNPIPGALAGGILDRAVVIHCPAKIDDENYHHQKDSDYQGKFDERLTILRVLFAHYFSPHATKISTHHGLNDGSKTQWH
jgi:hypothetical protein